MRTYVYGARAPIKNAEVVRQQMELAHRYYNTLIDIERERAVALAGLTGDARKPVNDRANARVREARGRCGVYWGTYLCIEDAVQRAAKMSCVVPARKEGTCPRCKQPFAVGDLITLHSTKHLLLSCAKCGNGVKYRRWEEQGLVAVELMGGMTVAELTSGEDTRVRLMPSTRRPRPGCAPNEKWRDLWLRVGSEGRAPVWAVFPIVYHREIPAGARIKWVRLCTHRCGTHAQWSAQFVLEAPEETWALPPPTKGAVAVDVGWRDFGPDGLRVATWVDDAGAQGELRLPREMLDRDAKVSDLRAIRDKNFLAVQDELLIERRVRSAGWPLWLCDATKTLYQWQSPARLAALVVRWRTQRWAGDEALFDRLEAWRRQDKHLLEWESHQREAILRQRREIYRLFARKLAQYRRVTVEWLALDKMAEVPSDPEERLARNSRSRRFDAGLSYLLGYAADAVHRAGGDFVEVDPRMTTQWCYEGDHEERFDAAAAVMHTCSCGRTWDQDVNAARNLLSPPAGLLTWQAARAPMIQPTSPRRSRVKVADPTQETPAQARRRKGLATRRARRSRTTGETPVGTDG